ncbi:V-type ATP synthase subunit I [Rhodovulum sp. P5]|uniref:V-type ATPase 116kDa subunit family protein n=1 Tax=Rhodovulum sp. P5 TaxID=1564506 RepID=UPI0009C3AE1E|nr:V-type ATPase 116kDa subunit family protein [Rhodovulum sp. P5]ARE40984.1 V-type ATP synthase subunit I [Rhodovulum sp. P5]
MLRPIATVWFELVVLNRDLARAMDCVARTRVVQLEARTANAGALTEARAQIAEAQTRYEAIRDRFRGYWPDPVFGPLRDDSDLPARFRDAVDRVEAWSARAKEIVADLDAARHAIDELSLLEDLFAAAESQLPDLGQLGRVGPRMAAFVGVAPIGTERPQSPDGLPVEAAMGARNAYIFALGPAADINDFAARAEGTGWRPVDLPGWLPPEAETALGEVRSRLDHHRARHRQREDHLIALHESHRLANVLGTVKQVQWLFGCARTVEESPRLARITGWAPAPELDRLQAGLADCRIFHVLAFPPPPKDADPPVVLFNPAWARRFEALTRMIGIPASGEADPTVVVALVAPLLFGFMFGDVGQGLVLVLAGVLLRRRVPALAILIPGGAMAMVFGLLFGSVFGREDVIPALWLHPLEEPILLLAISVGAGALLLLTGLAFGALQMHWQGRWRDWVTADAGLVLCYLGLLGAFVWGAPALGVAGAGTVWYIAGTMRAKGRGSAFKAFGEMVEAVLQLMVNTVSFARAGAFALAHAGLSVAVVGLADAAGPVAYWGVLALGNVFVLALEGLVVSIQTTRLLLFEFFIRFLTGGGREFRPLDLPGRPDTSPKEAL